jgi:hypothetical protein
MFVSENLCDGQLLLLNANSTFWKLGSEEKCWI